MLCGGMDGEMVYIFLGAGVVCGVVGMAVGGTKGNAGAGLVLGFLFGPIGILIAVLLPATQTALPRQCPYCRKGIPEGDFQRCCHCGGALIRKAFRQVNDPVDQWEAREKSGKKLPPLH